MPDTCKGCGADLLWGVTRDNHRIPLDAKAEKRFIFRNRPNAPPVVELVDTYITHFATCPKAELFRKRGSPENP